MLVHASLNCLLSEEVLGEQKDIVVGYCINGGCQSATALC